MSISRETRFFFFVSWAFL